MQNIELIETQSSSNFPSKLTKNREFRDEESDLLEEKEIQGK